MTAYKEGMTVGRLLQDHLDDEPSLTQKGLAAILNVEQPTVSRWIKERSVPGIEHRARLAIVLGLTEDEVSRAMIAQQEAGPLLERQVATLTTELATLRAEVAEIRRVLESRAESGSPRGRRGTRSRSAPDQ